MAARSPAAFELWSSSTSSNDDHRRLANPKQFRRRILNPHTDRKTRGEMHPVERPLHIRQTLCEGAHDVRVGRHTEPDAVYLTRKANVGFGQNIDVGLHSRRDVLELSFAEVGHRTPRTRV